MNLDNRNDETFSIEFEEGFIGMEIRNRRACKTGCMVVSSFYFPLTLFGHFSNTFLVVRYTPQRKFHVDKDGKIGAAEASGKIKRYMQLLCVNDIDLTSKSFQDCLQSIKSALRPMTITFSTKIDKRDLPSGVFKRALNRKSLLSQKKTNLFGLAKQFQHKFPAKQKTQGAKINTEKEQKDGNNVMHKRENKTTKKEKRLDISKIDIEDDVRT
jgi:hypothetical protein